MSLLAGMAAIPAILIRNNQTTSWLPEKFGFADECLLYFSLFLTLLAALLAVLGKQWLMYYSTAGERGTVEVHGLERQHKLDGLCKWRFDAVIQMFPLLLQLALLLMIHLQQRCQYHARP